MVWSVAPATPMTTLDIETIPSLAPRTAARSLFNVALLVVESDFVISLVYMRKLGTVQLMSYLSRVYQ